MIFLNQVVPANDINKRWPGFTVGEVVGLIEASKDGSSRLKLVPYLHTRTQTTPSGDNIYVCNEKDVGYYVIGDNNKLRVDFGGVDGTLGIVFDMNDIQNVEKEHPEYTWPVVSAEGTSKYESSTGMAYGHPSGTKGELQTSRTVAASKARDRKTAECWAEHLAVAVKMTVEIMKQDAREYTKRELVDLCKACGGDWKEESGPMKAFREALPVGYVHGAGAPKQS